MSDVYFPAICLVSGIVIIIILAHLHRISYPQQRRKVVSTALQCQLLIAGKGEALGTDTNKLESIQSRAIANQQLISHFGIDNAFTTSDWSRLKDFNREVKALMRLTDNDWQAIGVKSQHIIRNIISRGSLDETNIYANSQHQCVHLASMIQEVSLKVVLDIFFNQDALGLDDGATITAATEINRIWTISKTNSHLFNFIGGNKDPAQNLKKALTLLLPDCTFDSKTTPLNLILPAYETLWRVLLLGFVEVHFVSRDSQYKNDAINWRKTLLLFLENPAISLRPEVKTEEPDVLDIVNETLRLYPSVKRISRTFHLSSKWFPEKCAADLEALHRDAATWGNDAAEFNPARWKSEDLDLDEVKKSGVFLPFGYRPFTCPAGADFAPRMIALLLAALCKEMSSGWELRDESGTFPYPSGSLPSGRDCFKGWYLYNEKYGTSV